MHSHAMARELHNPLHKHVQKKRKTIVALLWSWGPQKGSPQTHEEGGHGVSAPWQAQHHIKSFSIVREDIAPKVMCVSMAELLMLRLQCKMFIVHTHILKAKLILRQACRRINLLSKSACCIWGAWLKSDARNHDCKGLLGACFHQIWTNTSAKAHWPSLHRYESFFLSVSCAGAGMGRSCTRGHEKNGSDSPL